MRRPCTKSSTSGSYRYRFPASVATRTNSPPGVAAIETGAGIGLGWPATFVPITVLAPRGTAVLPATDHSDPVPTAAPTKIIKPPLLAAITRGVASVRFALNGIGGDCTRPPPPPLSRAHPPPRSPPDPPTA